MCLLQLYVGSSQYYTGNSFNQAPASLETNAINFWKSVSSHSHTVPACLASRGSMNEFVVNVTSFIV